MTGLLARYPGVLPLALSLAALAIALFSQYGLGTFPCDLCIYQRYPYAVVILCSLLAMLPRLGVMRPILIALIYLGFVATGGIAAYHVGVEKGWIDGPSGCSFTMQGQESLDALRRQIMGAPSVSCADVGASLLGLSMAAWNGLYALACLLICYAGFKKAASARDQSGVRNATQ